MKPKKDARGFRRWPIVEDADGHTLEVHESSGAPLGKWTWITVATGNGASVGLHATKAQLKRVAEIIQSAIEAMP